MAETTGKEKKATRKKGESVKIESGTVELEEAGGADSLEGFTPEEVARMNRVRGEIGSGKYTDITTEHKKLLFVQWLIENEKLRS